jgi:dihydropteroate synthase
MHSRSEKNIEAKNTHFLQHTTLNCHGRLVALSNPLVMGVLNITPDSFYDGGHHTSVEAAVVRAGEMLEQGASIIDIGAVSTRPGSADITEKEELARMLPVLKEVISNHPDAVISVDTYRAVVAERAVEAGASIINDISGGTLDRKMFHAVAALGVPYVLTHIQGTPGTMQQNPHYSDVTGEVIGWLADRVLQLRELGVCDIVVDPGFGFGKSLTDNYTLMRELPLLSILQLPVMVGVSRKSMIYRGLNITPEESLTGTIALNYQALIHGAHILRVHDVTDAVRTAEIFRMVHPERPEDL